MKILIIEDEILLAESMKTLLTGKGFQVETVHDSEAGRDYAELGIYDLLILDVMMPGLDGYELAGQVRTKHHGTPILMLTDKSNVEDRIAGLNAGADYILSKPCDSRELLARLVICAGHISAARVYDDFGAQWRCFLQFGNRFLHTFDGGF